MATNLNWMTEALVDIAVVARSHCLHATDSHLIETIVTLAIERGEIPRSRAGDLQERLRAVVETRLAEINDELRSWNSEENATRPYRERGDAELAAAIEATKAPVETEGAADDSNVVALKPRRITRRQRTIAGD